MDLVIAAAFGLRTMPNDVGMLLDGMADGFGPGASGNFFQQFRKLRRYQVPFRLVVLNMNQVLDGRFKATVLAD